MAGVCEEAKIVFNVALAGTLEERGFERVSDAHYARKETIGEAEVIWRVLFGPPMKYRPMNADPAIVLVQVTHVAVQISVFGRPPSRAFGKLLQLALHVVV